MTPSVELAPRAHDATHEEVVIVRELLTVLVVLAVTGLLYALARNSMTF